MFIVARTKALTLKEITYSAFKFSSTQEQVSLRTTTIKIVCIVLVKKVGENCQHNK